MIKITLGIDGMMCGMCEAHVKESVDTLEGVKKVTASHTKNNAVIIANDDVDMATIKANIEKQGYRILSEEVEPYEEKKGLFAKWKQKK